MGFRSALKFIRYLDDANYNFMRVAVFIQQAEFHHRVVAVDMAFYVYNLVVLQVFLDVFLEINRALAKSTSSGLGL